MNNEELIQPVVTVKQSRKRLGKIVMIPLILGMIVLCVYSNGWKESLKLGSIRVFDPKSLTKDAILSAAGVPPRSTLYGVDLMATRQKILAQPMLKDARLNREFPSTLEIRLFEREPVAALNYGQMRYVDEEGIVLPYLDGDRKLDLPFIVGIDGIQSERVGKPIMNKELFTALEIIREAQILDSTIYHMISEIDMNRGGDIKLYSMDAGVPVILGRDDIPRKLLLFQTFWTNFVNAGDAQRLKYVDLRFEDQVVVRWIDGSEAQTKKASM